MKLFGKTQMQKFETVVATLQRGDFCLDPLGTSLLRLLLAAVHELRTGDALGESEMVVEHGSPRHSLVCVDDERLESRSPGENG